MDTRTLNIQEFLLEPMPHVQGLVEEHGIEALEAVSRMVAALPISLDEAIDAWQYGSHGLSLLEWCKGFECNGWSEPYRGEA